MHKPNLRSKAGATPPSVAANHVRNAACAYAAMKSLNATIVTLHNTPYVDARLQRKIDAVVVKLEAECGVLRKVVLTEQTKAGLPGVIIGETDSGNHS